MINSERQVNTIPSELISSVETLAIFFDAGHPKEHQKDLKKWRYHVINEEQYNCRHGAVPVLAHYEETLQLIKAADMLRRSNEATVKSIIATVAEIEQEKHDWVYFPANLKKKEAKNPLITIKKFFKTITLDQYKEIFHEWLRLALSNNAALETLSAKDIIEVYENLRKLYSATWIIHCRAEQRLALIDP